MAPTENMIDVVCKGLETYHKPLCARIRRDVRNGITPVQLSVQAALQGRTKPYDPVLTEVLSAAVYAYAYRVQKELLPDGYQE